MGWVWLALVGAGAMALLWRLGLARPLWSFAGAALMLGATGYAIQGRPALGGHPVSSAASVAPDESETIAIRDAMLGRFSGDGAYLVAADAMTRSGDRHAAVQAILGGIRRVPESVTLWTGLGTALAAHDGNRVSPPALFAFRQAMRLSPHHPAPPFFLGLAFVRAGDLDQAQGYWRRALALTPPEATYHRDVATRLALLDRIVASGTGSPNPSRQDGGTDQPVR